MARRDFEVFHYRDAGMPDVPMHHHDFFEVYYFLEGSVEYRVEGRVYRLSPGDVLLISPMELHRPCALGDGVYERIVLWIDRAFLERIGRGGVPVAQCFGTGRNRWHAGQTGVGALIRKLAAEDASGEVGSALYAEGLLLQLLAELLRLTGKPVPRDGGKPRQTLAEAVSLYIAEHCREEITLDELAGRFFVSKYHLSHAFTAAVGTSVHRYILLKRLQLAREMMAGGGSPGEACRACGFRDYANFYRAFRSVYGAAPRQVTSAVRKAIETE